MGAAGWERSAAASEQVVGICIIGLGNEHRGDDAVGIRIARQIASEGWDGVVAVPLNADDGTALLHAVRDAQTAYVVDAVSAEATPGTIIRLVLSRQSRFARFKRVQGEEKCPDGEEIPAPPPRPDRSRLRSPIGTISSHGLGVLEVMELGRTLGVLPERLVIYGIVGRAFDPGQGLSPEVERAAMQLIGRLYRIARRREAGRCTNSHW